MTTSARTRLRLAAAAAAAVTIAAIAVPALAERRGRGQTAALEINYLKTAIDHHFSALRMTELAVGTDQQRNQAITPGEGTAPSPGFGPTEARSDSDEIKSMARMANRMQREEILTAQRWLKDWYGITHAPHLTADGKAGLAILEGRHGEAFDHKFLEVFSRHHYPIIQQSVACVVGSDLGHSELKRYCRNIIETQMNGIEDMRHMLCSMFDICDFQPFSSVDGTHS